MFKNCYLRPVCAEDLPMILAWRNHEAVRKFMKTQHEIDIDEHESWFAMASADTGRRLLVTEDDSGPFGYVQLNNVQEGGVADWGFYVRPNAPKGSGKKLGQLVLDYAFRELKLRKVCGQAIEYNKASIKFHKKLGFVEEGVLRDQHRVEGKYYRVICFGLRSDEWGHGVGFKEMTCDED